MNLSKGRSAAVVAALTRGLRVAFACLVAIGVGWDYLRPGGDPGFGPIQGGLCLVGLAGLLFTVLPTAARAYAARGLLALTSMYASALVVEATVSPPVTRWGSVAASVQGMVRPSTWGGYELTPGWRGRYDDGVQTADIEINSLGDRDDLPSARDLGADERVLLLGDSFAFGWGLQKQETVEAQIEHESNGRAVAYNLGVGGYGPGDALEHYRERAAFSATHTFLLLYGNDLRYDNCKAAFHTAADGVIVPHAKADGSPYTHEDVEQKLRVALRDDGRLWLAQLKSALLLTQLRGRLAGLIRREYPLATGAPEQYTRECALSAAARADDMNQIARARGGRFAVVVVPTPGETLQHTYFERMQECMLELERRSIPVVEVRARLTPADYFPHHEHLNASGAQKVAKAILAFVEAPAEHSARNAADAPIARTSDGPGPEGQERRHEQERVEGKADGADGDRSRGSARAFVVEGLSDGDDHRDQHPETAGGVDVGRDGREQGEDEQDSGGARKADRPQ